MRWWNYRTTLHEKAFIDPEYIYLYVYIYIINTNFNFLLLLSREGVIHKGLISAVWSELDDGCLANITWTQQEREYDTTHSLKCSDDIKQVVLKLTYS